MHTVQRHMALGLTTTALLLGGGAHAQNVLDEVMKAKAIKIAVPTDYPPYGFVGADLKPQGLDVDMAQYIAQKLGVRLELMPVTSTNRLVYLQDHKADLVISTLGKNPEREKSIDFTSAYAPFFQAVFAAKGLSIKKWADLEGKSIAVTQGALEDQELAKVAPPGANIKRFEGNNATIAAFMAGQTQAIATSSSVAGSIMQRNPQLGVEYKLLLKDSPNFMGVAKGEDKLRAKVNEIVADAKKAGDLDKLSQKWLGRSAGDLPP